MAERERFTPGVFIENGRPYMLRADGHVHELRISRRVNDEMLRARIQQQARDVAAREKSL